MRTGTTLIDVWNLSSIGIIYRESDPSRVFMETKTPGYPRKVFVGKGLLPGGNWVGKAAAEDKGPRDTYIREILEELSFGNPAVDPNEMLELFGAGSLGHPPEKRQIEAGPMDIELLGGIVRSITENAKPFGVYLQHVPKYVFDSGDPENKAGDYRGAVSVFEVPLPDDAWSQLVDLQDRHGNLSNESQTLPTTAEEIVTKQIRIGWGQDRVLQEHFLRHGIEVARGMSLIAGIAAVRLFAPLPTYAEYLRIFDIEKLPEGVASPAMNWP